MEHSKKIRNSRHAKSTPSHWGWILALGILLLIFGTIGLGMEILLTIVSMYFFSALLLISGLSHIADAFKYKKWKGAMCQVLIGFLYIFAAGVILYDPLLASTIITGLLAWTLIIIGITRIGMCLFLRDTKGWGWILLAGISALVLGVLILMQWPMSGLWVIGLFIAIEMIISGWTYIFIAMSLRATQD